MKLFCAHCGGRWTGGPVYFTAQQPPVPVVYCPRCAPAAKDPRAARTAAPEIATPRP